MGNVPQRRARPQRIEDGQGVLRSYAELIALLQRQLGEDGTERRRVVVDGRTESSLSWRRDRIEDMTKIVKALCEVHIPFTARSSVITHLVCLRHQLKVLHWPDREAELRQQLSDLIRRLKHTTRKPGVPDRIRRKLKPAATLPRRPS